MQDISNLTLALVPIKAAASALSLPVYEIDTFTGWKVIYKAHEFGILN